VYQDANIKVTASEHAHFRTHLILTGDDDPDAHHYLDAVKKFYSGSVDLAGDLKQF